MRCLALALLISCTPAQAHRVHDVGEAVVVAGVAGLVALGIAGAATQNKPVIYTEIGFAALMTAGAAAFWSSDKGDAAFEQQAAQQKFDAAFALARTAKHAARAGDCAQVQAIEPQVRQLDESVYRRFRRDAVIATCLPARSAP